MEFFGKVHSTGLEVSYLQNLLSINDLPELCASISTVAPQKNNEAGIYCIWGSFHVKREEIRYGVRFSLLDCPHALAWTITFDEESESIIIHCTINETETDQDFIDSINEFVIAWSNGISAVLESTHNNAL